MGLVSRVLLAGLVVGISATSFLGSTSRARKRKGEAAIDGQMFVTGDGEHLPLSRWQAPGARATVLGLHAFADYRHGFDRTGGILAARGFDVVAYDQRGFGESRARGRWPGIDTLIQDLAEAARTLVAERPSTPVVVLGESLGGSVALAAALRGHLDGISGLVLAAPVVRAHLPAGEAHDLALRVGSMALPWQPDEIRRGGRPWLDPGEASRIADDPLILRRLDGALHQGVVETLDATTRPAAAFTLPTLILHGALDTVVGPPLIDDLTAMLDGAATLRRYPDHHHLLLHERGADDILDDVAAWIDQLPAAGGADTTAND